MRRMIALMLALGLLFGMVATAEAAKKKKKKPTVRTFEVAYSNSVAIGGVGGSCPAGNCPDVPIGTGETFAMIFIEDDFNSSGYVEMTYDADGDGFQGDGEGPTVCGSTPEPVPVEPGVTYTAWPYMVGTGCAGSSSFSGTITYLFSSDPAALEKAAAKL